MESSSIEILDISWERIFLNITINILNKNLDVNKLKIGLFNKDINKFIVTDLESINNQKYKITINITCVDNRNFLPNGEWHLGYFIDNDFIPISINTKVVYKFDELSRIFRYGNKSLYAYVIDFNTYTLDKEDELYFILNSYFMKKNNKWQKRNFLEEGKNEKNILKKMLFSFKIKLSNLTYNFFSLFKGKKHNKIMFMSENSETISGNLRALDKKIKDLKIDKKYKITYSFRRAIGSKQSLLSWFKLIYKIAMQDYIFLDNYSPIFNYLNVKKDTSIIQLWHAGAGFKAVGYCRFGKKGSPYPCTSVHKKYKYGIVGSKNLIKVFEEVWGIEKNSILPLGMPRLDDYLNKEKIQKFKNDFYKDYPELKGKKIILFAPTYRGSGQEVAYYDFNNINLKQIYDFCQEEYVFLIKMHPFILDKISIPSKYSKRIYDFSDYNDINNLYYITDIFITDYSSSYYEFSLMHKPIIFYTYDREIYELTRGVYKSIKDTAPGKVCDTFDEVITSLKNKDFEINKTLAFAKENFENYNNDACEKILKAVLKEV